MGLFSCLNRHKKKQCAGNLQAQRRDAGCNQCLVTSLTKQIFPFFPPECDGLLGATDYSSTVTCSAVNRLSNSAEPVFIIPDVDVAAMCAFAAGDSAW